MEKTSNYFNKIKSVDKTNEYVLLLVQKNIEIIGKKAIERHYVVAAIILAGKYDVKYIKNTDDDFTKMCAFHISHERKNQEIYEIMKSLLPLFLIEALKDTDYEVLLGTVEALGKIGNETAVQMLIEALIDTNYWVRLRAALSLYQLIDHNKIMLN